MASKEIPLDMLNSGFETRTEDFIGKKAYDKIIDAFERAILSPTDQDLFYLRTFVNGLCAFIENNQLDIEQYRRQQSKKKLKENN